jgi:hypothetical protein
MKYKNIIAIENILIKSNKFNLPKRKEILMSENPDVNLKKYFMINLLNFLNKKVLQEV